MKKTRYVRDEWVVCSSCQGRGQLPAWGGGTTWCGGCNGQGGRWSPVYEKYDDGYQSSTERAHGSRSGGGSTSTGIGFTRPEEWTGVNVVFFFLGFLIAMYYTGQMDAFAPSAGEPWVEVLGIRALASLALGFLTGVFSYIIIVLGLLLLFYWVGLHLGYFKS